MMGDGEKRKRKNAGIEAKRMDDVRRLGWRTWWGAKRMDEAGLSEAEKQSGQTSEAQIGESEAVNRGASKPR